MARNSKRDAIVASDERGRAPTDPGRTRVWWVTLLELRNDRFPDLRMLAAALRRDEQVPYEVRVFLADYLDGKIKKPRGRPRASVVEELFSNVGASMIYRTFVEENRAAKARGEHLGDTPSELALVQTTEHLRTVGHHMEPETIRDAVYPRRRRKK
jgi:hypothetical protein